MAHGSHGKMMEKPGRANIVDVLRGEFRKGKGRILVSGESVPPNSLRGADALKSVQKMPFAIRHGGTYRGETNSTALSS